MGDEGKTHILSFFCKQRQMYNLRVKKPSCSFAYDKDFRFRIYQKKCAMSLQPKQKALRAALSVVAEPINYVQFTPQIPPEPFLFCFV
jgi:hypothetical protein